jgi:hypothetical protein
MPQITDLEKAHNSIAQLKVRLFDTQESLQNSVNNAHGFIALVVDVLDLEVKTYGDLLEALEALRKPLEDNSTTSTPIQKT